MWRTTKTAPFRFSRVQPLAFVATLTALWLDDLGRFCDLLPATCAFNLFRHHLCVMFSAEVFTPLRFSADPAYCVGFMKCHVSGMGAKLQITNPIVGGDFVFVVNQFAAPERSSQMSAHNPSVFSNVAFGIGIWMTWLVEQYVAIVNKSPTLPIGASVRVAFHKFEVTFSASWRRLTRNITHVLMPTINAFHSLGTHGGYCG